MKKVTDKEQELRHHTAGVAQTLLSEQEKNALNILEEAKETARKLKDEAKLSPAIILAIQEIVEKEREKSDKSYAIKLVERILFAILALFGISTMTYFINLFLK